MLSLLAATSFDVLSFFLKVVIFVGGILVIIGFAMRNKSDNRISIKNLNKQLKSYKKIFLTEWLQKKDFKKYTKEEKNHEDEDVSQKPKSFLVHFKGDIKASEVDSLKECINAILTVAQTGDEVVVSLESPGGMVHGYGLAASQLDRVKKAGIRLTICVDKVAASGGYMIACLADKIISAPFAIIGSVGVIASIPNFNKILKKNDIDFYQMTAGKYKRTMTLFGEITEDGKEKFKEELEETHVLFKQHIKTFRPIVDVDAIATGEHWYGIKAFELKLVDELGTSDAYIQMLTEKRLVLEVSYKPKKTLAQKISEGAALLFDRSHEKLSEIASKPSTTL